MPSDDPLVKPNDNRKAPPLRRRIAIAASDDAAARRA